MPTPMTVADLIRHIAAYEPFLPRTFALEQRIKIGTGFHRKWYRSQREHWLGHLTFVQSRDTKNGRSPGGGSAKTLWNGLQCSPMMFWLAEAAGAPAALLAPAEEAAICASAICPVDGAEHKKMMKLALPWETVEQLLRSGPSPVSQQVARREADEAFDHLLPRYSDARKYAAYRPTA